MTVPNELMLLMFMDIAPNRPIINFGLDSFLWANRPIMHSGLDSSKRNPFLWANRPVMHFGLDSSNVNLFLWANRPISILDWTAQM